MTVPGIVIHPQAQKQLDTFLRSPSHAVLLSGTAGIGKTHIACQLAIELLSVHDLENEPYYRALLGKNGTITIEQIRELIGFFRLSVPGKGLIKRVAVVQDADQMGIEAQNALLKLLEEPPKSSVLILSSSHPQELLPTIRSRTRILNISVPEKAALTKYFTEAGYTLTAVESALLRSNTDVAAAWQLLENGTEATDDPVQLAKQILSGTSYDRLLLVDGLAKQKEAANSFVDTLATVAMVSLESAATKHSPSVKRWHTVLQAVDTAQQALQGSGNTKLVLTELMLAI